MAAHKHSHKDAHRIESLINARNVLSMKDGNRVEAGRWVEAQLEREESTFQERYQRWETTFGDKPKSLQPTPPSVPPKLAVLRLTLEHFKNIDLCEKLMRGEGIF